MLNGLGFAFSVIRFYFAFTILLLYPLALNFFYIDKHCSPYFVGAICKISGMID